MMPTAPTRAAERRLTELDAARLRRFAGQHAVPRLAELPDTADLLDGPAVPPDTVTMYSRVCCDSGIAVVCA